jgi:DNA helicase-2/ATP-dependent DNA helicase PcrA
LNSETLLNQLNPQQREAVLAVEGPVLVVAGPGTGKTRCLTSHLAYLTTGKHIPAESLLAVTFTARAAREMDKRLQKIVGEAAGRLCLGTFHGICLQFLRAEGRHLDLPADFGVCDRRDQLVILQRALASCGKQTSHADGQRLLQQLSQTRNHDVDPEAQLAAQDLLDLYRAYRARLRKQKLLDFDDLLSLTVALLESCPEVRKRLRRRYPFISVDEYQDVNPLQYRLLQQLTDEHTNLWAVGDADQAIYAFRGAQVENFLHFERDFPGTRVIRLELGYRSTPQIVAAASQVIARNETRIPFVLRTDNPNGQPAQIINLPDEDAEAAWVVRAIEQQVGGTSHYQHYKGQVQDAVTQRQRSFRDFAVLFRLNALSRPLEEALARSGIPYRIISGTHLFDRKAVKDLLAYLRVVRHPEDDVSLSRVLNVPPRGIGAQTQAALEIMTEQTGATLYDVLQAPHKLSASQTQAVAAFVRLLRELSDGLPGRKLSEFLAWTLAATGLGHWWSQQDPRHENQFVLLRALAAQYDDMTLPDALDRFLSEAALATDADDYDVNADAVTLMTLHAAKGLEFTEVFLCGMEEEILPYTKADLEEERRLFYVGLTRARERAHLLSCRSRFLFGERRQRPPSRFITEFDTSLQETTTIPDRTRRSKEAEKTEQLPLL